MLERLKKLFASLGKRWQKPTLLNLYQYKFWRYKNARAAYYPLNISNISCPVRRGLVSIVLPVYNGADLVGDSIESVLLQTYRNFELIIIDDCSTDETRHVLERYARRDDRIKLLMNEENLKIPRTLSRGFKEARGEFLTWTSADNIMDDRFIEEMVRELQQNPNIGMVYGNMRLIDARGKVYRRHGWYEKPIRSGNVILPNDTLELNTYANNYIGAAFMYRAVVGKTLEDYSKFRHTLEDYDYWMKVNSLFQMKHTSISTPLYLYRWHNKSLTAQDKELGITTNRYKLMLFDDMRRDFYLSPLVWYIETDREDEEMVKYTEEFKSILKSAGHIYVSREEVDLMLFSGQTRCMCCISFGQDRTKISTNGGNPFEGILKEVEKELAKYSTPIPVETDEPVKEGDTKEFYIGDEETVGGEFSLQINVSAPPLESLTNEPAKAEDITIQDENSIDDLFEQAAKQANELDFDPFEGIFEPDDKEQLPSSYSPKDGISQDTYPGEFKIPKGAVRAFVSRDPKADIEKQEEQGNEPYDIYISANTKQELTELSNYDGWFGINDTQTMFSFLDTKIKTRLLAQMEEMIEGGKNYTKKVSVILCTNKKTQTLIQCLQSLCEQSFPAEDYEIVFVNNNYKDMRVARVFEVFMNAYPHINLRYVSAPIPGLSFARNAGMWAADGEYQLYIDDDAIAERNWIEEMYKCFISHPEAGVIGGQIILIPPDPRPRELGEGLEALWSGLTVPYTEYHECENYSEFPFGANFGVHTKALLRIGGFRASYGRMSNNYGGGEETAVCFMMDSIGRTVGLNPYSKVYHNVDPNRYSFTHIERTTIEGILTQYRMRLDLYAPQDWSDSYIQERIKTADKQLRNINENTPEYVQKDAEKQAFLKVMEKLNQDYENREIM